MTAPPKTWAELASSHLPTFEPFILADAKSQTAWVAWRDDGEPDGELKDAVAAADLELDAAAEAHYEAEEAAAAAAEARLLEVLADFSEEVVSGIVGGLEMSAMGR